MKTIKNQMFLKEAFSDFSNHEKKNRILATPLQSKQVVISMKMEKKRSLKLQYVTQTKHDSKIYNH